MKILLINNFYYSRGGDCTYLFSLKNLLEEKGHTVIIFSMRHPQNIPSKYSKYFVSYINYDEEVRNITLSSAVKVFNRTIYSNEAKNQLEKLIKHESPDIAHLQNIHHHITPSILPVLKRNKIPIIWTLHDYSLICPNTSFLSHGKVCEKCKRHMFFWPSIEKCKKESFSASTMSGLESSVHHLIGFNNMVDSFIAPSAFIRNKFIEYGINENKLIRLDHFVDFKCPCDEPTSYDYYLYVGRLTEEKGVKTLIDAAVKVNTSKLKIVGAGPILETMIDYAKSKDKNNLVEFLGHKSHEELIDIYRNCKFIVVPSEWYEIAGLIILEAFSCGKPAIGSNMGGIPELIKDTERGLIFKAGDSEDLSLAIKFLIDNPDLVSEMGANAQVYVENELSRENHYKQLMKIYQEAVL